MIHKQRAASTIAVGKLLIIGFDGTRMTSGLGSLLTRLQPAGVILFTRNIESVVQTWQLLCDCQKCVSTPLFTCVDLEGGSVDRFREMLGPSPSPADVFATRERKLFRKHGRLIGENCRTLGFNIDFAPVLDLAFEASRKVLRSRAVSVNPKQVAAYAREFLAGLRAANVLGCGKHFPGLGEGKLDSHHRLPVIDKPFDKLWTEDLLAYRMLRSQLPMVMISHAAYPAVTHDRTPASLSKMWISDILRKKIGYRNLIVSDDLEMGGVLSAAPVGDAAVRFIRAGGDLCLICHREDRVMEIHKALAAEIKRDPKFAKRVTDSMQRVAIFKKRASKFLRRGNAPSPASAENLSRKLWEFGEQVRLEILARAEKPKKQNPDRRRA